MSSFYCSCQPYGRIFYNQEKVDKIVGTVLAMYILWKLVDDNFNVGGIAEDVLQWIPDHFRTEKPVIHISFDPDGQRTAQNEQLEHMVVKISSSICNNSIIY